MTRTLFIGLDGATFTILDQLTRDRSGTGPTMPFLSRLLANGARAKLKSTPNPLTPPAWASLMTGRSPGHHGIMDFMRYDDDGRDIFFTFYNARDIKAETIWSIAARQGRKTIALNFPMMAPPEKNSGIIVPGFVHWKHIRRNVAPRSVYDRLKEIEGFDPKYLALDFRMEQSSVEAALDPNRVFNKQELIDWIDYHMKREDQWHLVARYLLQEEDSDLLAVVFDGVDKLQHQAWFFLNEELFPDDPEPWQREVREAGLAYFRRLDGHIQDLVELAGPQANVFFASDHGFTTTVEAVRINSFLHERGYLFWEESDGSDASVRREASWFANLDWTRTVAYAAQPSSNGITIRVARKPGDAGVAPEEYEALRDRLIQDLQSLRDEESGERIIKNIEKREDVFPGPAMDRAPDLTLTLRDHGFVAVKNALPVVAPRQVPAGSHHPDGIFIAHGPDIEAGASCERRRIEDVAATLLHSIGLPTPEDFEGRVADPVFSAEHLMRTPVQLGAPTAGIAAAGGDGEASMSDEAKEQMLEQLKLLGYME